MTKNISIVLTSPEFFPLCRLAECGIKPLSGEPAPVKTGFVADLNILRFLPSPLFLLSMVLAAILFLGGCTARSTSELAVIPQHDVDVAIDAPDETMAEPYQPIDDGQPLTREELAAFESTGELDANLSLEEKQIVELHFKFFVHTHRETMERYLKRSELYLPYVRERFRARGIPEELACLAFVESGFNPNAVSRAGAGGMWQFMPYTGKKYGLDQDRWIDERRDPYKATDAAIEYLSKLYEMFQDWHLALAAYNAGEGKIGRALTGTDAKNFFELCRKNEMLDYKAQLRAETRQYVPRFLAVTKIVRNLELLGFTSPAPNRALKVAAVRVPAGVDLRQFAASINVGWEQFKGMNPAYRRTISPTHKSTIARVPVSRQEQATAWLSRKDAGLYAGWRDYRVRSGDSMGSIAKRTGVNTAALRQANGKQNNSLRIGEYMLVPGSAGAARATMKSLAPETVTTVARKGGKPAGGFKGTHAVASGDTLYALALAWGSTVADICELNNIDPGKALRVGQSLYIPSGRNITLAAAAPEEQTPAAKPAVSMVSRARSGSGGGTYIVVQRGDTLFSIARTNKCSVADICKANNITPKTRLQVGRELHILPGIASAQAAKVPKAVTASRKSEAPLVVASGGGRSVVIQSGDTLYSLARAHNTSVAAIAKLNGIKPGATLRLGQTIQLP